MTAQVAANAQLVALEWRGYATVAAVITRRPELRQIGSR
jgi:hypothetical protein